MPGPMSSQGTKIFLSDSMVAHAISNVSKAAPAVVTIDAECQAAVGEPVFIQGTGFASLDNKAFTIEAKTAIAPFTVTLEDTDTTGETAAGNTGTLWEAADLIEVCMASLSRESPAAATLDVTTLCDSERQQRTGMKNNGTWTMQGFYDPGSPGQQRLRAAYDAGDDRLMKVVPPDQSEILFRTQVNQLSESFAVDQPVQVNAGGLVMGGVQYVLPPGAVPIAAARAAAPAPAA